MDKLRTKRNIIRIAAPLTALAALGLVGCAQYEPPAPRPVTSPLPATPSPSGRALTQQEIDDRTPVRPVELEMVDVAVLGRDERRDMGDLEITVTTKSVSGKTLMFAFYAMCKNGDNLDDPEPLHQNDLFVTEGGDVALESGAFYRNADSCIDNHQVDANEAANAVSHFEANM